MIDRKSMPMSDQDPRKRIDLLPMTAAQFTVVGICVLLNAMDGFDILSIAFASPGIAKEWGINQLGLGIVLSMELIGMGLGAMFMGSLADKFGRRPVLLGCLVLMAGGMLLATTAASPVQLSLWRVLTGLGIGGMLAGTNAVVAEFTNNRWRSLCISIMVIGYPLGGGFGGLYASSLIARYDWRAVFYFGSAATALLLPVSFYLIPESIPWLWRKQPLNALERINRSLRSIGHATVTALPEVSAADSNKSRPNIFSTDMITITLLVTAAYFLHVTSFYFLLKWAPKIVADLGFPPPVGGRVLTMSNFGGAAGGALFGILSSRVRLKPLTMGFLFFNALAITVFGRSAADLDLLTVLAVVVGFFGNGAMSGMYSLGAYAFPTHMRATGTGFVIGVGRAGAVISPWIAGFLLQSGAQLPTVAIVMSAGSLLAGIVLLLLKLNAGQSGQVQEAASGLRNLKPSVS